MSSSPAPQAPGSSLAGGPGVALLAQMADVLVWPLLLLQPDGHLLHANLAARQLLQRGWPLQLTPDQRVAAAMPPQQLEFSAALQTAAATGRMQVLHWPGSGLDQPAKLTALGTDASGQTALLLALAPAEGRTTDVLAFAALHSLTPAETRVLQRLSQGDNTRRAAAALGVAPATVRSQIVSLRHKTGHASIAGLARALAHMPPLGWVREAQCGPARGE